MMLLRTLGSICSARVQLPHTMILSDGVERCGDIAVASGGFTDTWQGLYRTKKVALKAFRTYPVQDQKEVEKVCRMVSVNIVFIFENCRRPYGRRSLYGRGCLTSTFYHSTVLTMQISSLRSSTTGRTLEISSNTCAQTQRSPAPTWYCRQR